MSEMKTMDEMRATITAAALATAAELSSSTLGDSVRELLQNARRAGATRIEFDTSNEGILQIRDNGHGMLDPAAVVTYGMSAWRPELAGEQPTGMGLFSLANDTVRIETRAARDAAGGEPARGPWEMRMQPGHFRGDKPVAVSEAPDAPRPHGTVVSIRVDRVKTWWLEELVRFFPIPVWINGEQAPREGVLDGAKETVGWAGLQIGLFDATGDDPKASWFCWQGATSQLRLADNETTGYARVLAEQALALRLTRPGLWLRGDDAFTMALTRQVEKLLAGRSARVRGARSH